MTRLRVGAVGILFAACLSAAVSALAAPQSATTTTLARTAADYAAVVTFGLSVVPVLDVARYRDELSRRAAAPLALAAAAWLVSEGIRLVVAAAQTAGVATAHLGITTLAEYALRTAPGRAGMLAVVAAALVCLAVAVLPRSASAAVAVTGLAAIGVTARPLSGHLADSALGGLAVAVHAVTAAAWCGALVALLLTVEHRGQWARVLPRFSRLALWCVAAMLVAGVAGAVAVLRSPAELWATAHGRLLLAKIAVTGVLLALAWRNRSIWLPAARGHRAAAVVSRRRALVEVATMAIALTLAAALAVAD